MYNNMTKQQTTRPDGYWNSHHFGPYTGTGYPHYGGAGSYGRQQSRKYSYHLEGGNHPRGSYAAYDEPYDRRSPAHKGNSGKVSQGYHQQAADVYFNAEKTVIYVKKGGTDEDYTMALNRAASQTNDVDRLSSYSTNSSDEDSATKRFARKQKGQNFNDHYEDPASSVKVCKEQYNVSISVFLKEEEVATYLKHKNVNKGKKQRKHGRQAEETKFAGTEIKSAPANLATVPIPTFAL